MPGIEPTGVGRPAERLIGIPQDELWLAPDRGCRVAVRNLAECLHLPGPGPVPLILPSIAMMRAVVLDQSAGSSDSEIGTGNRLPVFVQDRSLYFDRHLARRVQQSKQRFPW